MQFALVEQPQVGRNAVAGSEHDDVARHQSGRIELPVHVTFAAL